MKLLAILSCGVLLSCNAGNAVLDGNVRLPALPSGSADLFTVVQVMRTTDFAVSWEGATLPEAQALGTSPASYEFSVVSENTVDDVLVKFRFCRDEACQATRCPAGTCGPEALRADPQAEIWVRLETPLYAGEFTEWDFEFPAIPRCVGGEEPCEEITEPPTDPRECELDERFRDVGYPVWSCTVQRCDIVCARAPGAVAGNCDGDDGRTGAHFCAP